MYGIQEVCRPAAYSVAEAKLANGSLNGGWIKKYGIQEVCQPSAYSVATAKLANGSLNGGRIKKYGIQKVCRRPLTVFQKQNWLMAR